MSQAPNPPLTRASKSNRDGAGGPAGRSAPPSHGLVDNARVGTVSGVGAELNDATGQQPYDLGLLRRLAGFARPQRRLFLAALAFSPMTALAVAVRPHLTQRVIDAAVVEQDQELLHTGALYYLLAVSVQFLGQSAHMYLLQVAGQHMMASLRDRAFRHAGRLRLRYFDRTPVGRILTRVTNDIDTLGESFASGAVTVVTDLLSMLGIVAMMLYVDWRWTLITLAVVPPMALVVQMLRRHAREAFRAIRTRVAQLNAFLSEQVQGIEVVQAYGRQAACAREYEQINAAYRDANYRAIKLDALLHSVVEAISVTCVAAVLWYASVQAGALSEPERYIGTVVAFYQFIHLFFVPLRDLSTKYTLIQSSLASAERVVGFLDVEDIEEHAPPPESGSGQDGPQASTSGDRTRAAPVVAPTKRAYVQENQEAPVEDGVRSGPPAAAIEFREVTFGYRDSTPVLDRVSFQVGVGEKVAVVGATGAGKSTLVSLLLRLYHGWQGTIRVHGDDAALLDVHGLRARFSVVPQDAFLFAGSVLDNLVLGDDKPDLDRAEQVLRRVGAWELVSRRAGGMRAVVETRGGNFSAGERQLLAFARALYRAGSILILDEATANVDSETETRLQGAVTELLRERTALIIAHRLSTIRQVDRILVFHRGRVVEQGTHAELMARGGVYARLYRLHFQKRPPKADLR